MDDNITIWSETTEGAHPHRITFGVLDSFILAEENSVFERPKPPTSTAFAFKKEIVDWLEEGIEGNYKFKTRKKFFWKNIHYQNTYSVCFSDLNDAALFKLSWS